MRFIAGFILFFSLIPSATQAAIDPILQEVYWSRPDLQAAFEPERFRAIPGTRAGFLIDLEDWAHQYGWQEQGALSVFKPTSTFTPHRKTTAVQEPSVTAQSYLVLDRTSGLILAAKNADEVRSLASLTKLMTAEIVLDRGIPMDKRVAMQDQDDVGGAKLYVNEGEEFSVDSLFYATLVASANNAANALARSSGYSEDTFVRAMNGRADLLNLTHTRFVDPSGIEPENVSTAREIAMLANEAFSRQDIRRYTTTAKVDLPMLTSGGTKTLKTTNWMLYSPEYNDVYVTGGKTGYLEEAKWNVVVALRPAADEKDKELLLVVLGADSRGAAFKDARTLAGWTWEENEWKSN
ncbi:D-alanyl-D-alanine carboxypeptidase [Candidatus Uhrbacteria bacterium]|nr:D-alanyl-D-alanine carboxypeptidase [Candidatus Uhrbacteria bacterium]